MTHTPTLKPCPNPWCEADEREGDFSPVVRPTSFGNWQVCCTSCQQKGPVTTNEPHAITAWNTRTVEAGGVQELVEAAREARECLRLGAVVPLRDTANYDEVSALGNRIGFGALMATASLAWRDECGEMAGGEFVCGPCRSTSEKAIVKIDTALSKWEASK